MVPAFLVISSRVTHIDEQRLIGLVFLLVVDALLKKLARLDTLVGLTGVSSSSGADILANLQYTNIHNL